MVVLWCLSLIVHVCGLGSVDVRDILGAQYIPFSGLASSYSLKAVGVWNSDRNVNCLHVMRCAFRAASGPDVIYAPLMYNRLELDLGKR